MSVRRPLAATAATLLAAVGVATSAGTAAAAPSAPAASARTTYIVTVAPGTPAATAIERSRRLGGEIEHVYTAALNGFAVTLPENAAAQLPHLPGVVAVEADQVLHADETVQSPATWGLDRIDQALPSPSSAVGSFGYTRTGTGVSAYVIDTGIYTDHAEFAGRATVGVDELGGDGQDCNGHGTHVAGTIGGTSYGVAKNVHLIAVRVLDCSGNGSTAGVIAGIDWVTATHQPGQPAVANMSLGGGASTALDQAVQRSISDGVTYAVAAGNGNSAGVPQDACKSSPARVTAALTVAATDRTDAAASFSNYGKCVDLFAPGVGITSAWIGATDATNTISGTSMATPHVTGVAALYLETTLTPTGTTAATPATVSGAVLGAVNDRAVRTTRTSNNDLLYTDW